MSNIYVHPTAEVDKGAMVGDGTKIWNQAQVREGARLGEGCVVSKNVYIDENVQIGSRVKIQNNVNVYHGVTIEDDVFLGPSMTFTNDMYPRAFSREWKVSDTLVKRGASIGANASIRCGITIGEYATIGIGSTVVKDVPAHALVVGNPARQIGWVCECGYKLDECGKCVNCMKEYPQYTQNKTREE
ncbi:N-acetyltransferase [bacterium 1XD8-76]|nr:N-acetyltransferase [bacterium 1XD8-76]